MAVSEEILGGFNPFDPAFRVNPYAVYENLRMNTPVHMPLGAWVFSRYADCMRVLHDPNVSSDEKNSDLYKEFAKQQEVSEFVALRDRMKPFLFMDPPDHTRLRGLVAKAFTPRVVQDLKPRIQQIVDDLIDAAEPTGEIEIIEDFAYPLPVTVISELLGVPPSDWEKFKGWSRELARSLDPEIALPKEVLDQRREIFLTFVGYFRELIADHKASPRNDLLSALIAAEEEGEQLTEDELLSTCVLLLIAGHETTVNLIGNGMLALLRNQDQLERLRQDSSLARTAVEEVLRYDSPVQMTGRTALEDIDVDGVVVKKGQQAVILLASANRDSAQFDNPDRFDVGRTPNPHISFSQGIHFCLGAPLARVEGQAALATIARRLKKMELQVEQPEYKENIVLRGLAALPVSFST